MPSSSDLYLAQISGLLRAIVRGDAAKVNTLLQLANPAQHPVEVAELAEQIGNLIVQKEAHEFRLEGIIEDLLHAQAQLELAKHDPLTGLPNRAMFHDLLREHCNTAKHNGHTLALMFIDLDKFKQVNDSMGHDAGDELLEQVAARLTENVGEGNIVARLGGDEFTAILPVVESQETALATGQRMVEQVGLPFLLQAGKAQIGASIGLTFYPQEADTPIALLKNADIAMYKAKESGRNCCLLYQSS